MGWESKNFINLSEVGFDIAHCKIDFSIISVRCCDLARYRKAIQTYKSKKQHKHTHIHSR
jgi:hypothetical protein